MRKKISSKSNLTDMALKTGATVTDQSGKNFNKAKKKAVKRMEAPEVEKPKEIKKAEPALKLAPQIPPLNPATADEGSKVVAERLDSMSKANALMMAELIQQISAIKFNAAQPITDWEFDFIRDDKGYLVKLLASAKIDKRVIN